MELSGDYESLDLEEAIQYGITNNRFSQITEVRFIEICGSQSASTALKGVAFREKLKNLSKDPCPNLRIRTFTMPWYDDKIPISITAADMALLCKPFHILPPFIRGMLEVSNWVRLGNGLFVHKDNGKCSSIDMFYRNYNGKPRGRTFIYSGYDAEKNMVTNIWVNPTPDPQTILNIGARNSANPAVCRYFAIRAAFMQHCLSTLTSNGCRLRNEVIQEETGPHNLHPEAMSESLHRLATDLYTLIEHLYDLEELIRFLIKASNRISKVVEDEQAREILENTDTLGHILSTTAKAGRWAFHLSTQADNDINLQISSATKSIAHEAQRDSLSMITIAAVTMFFLPGTFVSALFSMTFFNFQEDGLGNQQFQVSDKWWYYVAVTVPLTIVVFLIWIDWQRLKFGNVGKDEDNQMVEGKSYI